MDYLLPMFGLLLILAVLFGATIKINTLLIGKKINFLENNKITSSTSFIFIGLFVSAILINYFNGYVYYWYDFISFTFSIALLFAIGRYTPSLITYLRELHQSNLEDAEEQALREVD